MSVILEGENFLFRPGNFTIYRFSESEDKDDAEGH